MSLKMSRMCSLVLLLFVSVSCASGDDTLFGLSEACLSVTDESIAEEPTGDDMCPITPYEFPCSCNSSVPLCDSDGNGICFCDPDCEGLSCTDDGVCERRCANDPDCDWGCICDRLFGLCNTLEPGVSDPCDCDIDCITARPCVADAHCDRDCPSDPDCEPGAALMPIDPPAQMNEIEDYRGLCTCDRRAEICEAAHNGTGDVCACDPDC